MLSHKQPQKRNETDLEIIIMSLIYILNSYGEYGPEDIRVCESVERVRVILGEIHTDERARIVGWGWLPKHLEENQANQADEKSKLEAALVERKIGSYNLSKGWGGYQLHIVELEK